jgi:hypothetical protein
MESPHRKATEHESARGKVDVVWLRPRPEDGSLRCRMGSAASMGPKYHAEPRRTPRGMPVTHLSPLGTLRRAVTRPASMADVHPPRTQRICVHIPPFRSAWRKHDSWAFCALFWENHFIATRTSELEPAGTPCGGADVAGGWLPLLTFRVRRPRNRDSGQEGDF